MARALVSIPGQIHLPHRYPPDRRTIEATLARLAALDADLVASHGPCRLGSPRPSAAIAAVLDCQGGETVLNTRLRGDVLSHLGPAISIHWRWSVLWGRPDWYETGWMPDAMIKALKRPGRERLWRTMNPLHPILPTI